MNKDLDTNDRSLLQALRADAVSQLACPSRSQAWADAYREFHRAVDRLDAMWARVEIGQAHIVAAHGLGDPIAAPAAPAQRMTYAGPWCCEKGKAEGRPICKACTEILNAYAAAPAAPGQQEAKSVLELLRKARAVIQPDWEDATGEPLAQWCTDADAAIAAPQRLPSRP